MALLNCHLGPANEPDVPSALPRSSGPRAISWSVREKHQPFLRRSDEFAAETQTSTPSEPNHTYRLSRRRISLSIAAPRRPTVTYRGTKTHRAETVAEMVCWPGSIGVGAAAALAISIRASYITGRTGVKVLESSRRLPSVPPAARASDSASALAWSTASANADRRTESAFDEVN